MPAIEFRRTEATFTIHNPFNNFAQEEHRVEVRSDPLLGDTSVYNPHLKDKAKFFFGQTDAELIRKLAEDSAAACIFCGASVEQKTARYPDGLIPGGRIKTGEAVLFANLFSVGAYHPVIVLSKAHFLKLSELRPDLLADGFRAAQRFLHAVYQKDPSALFATVNANYLLPAGASLVHPHMQMLVTPVAYSYHARLMEASGAYYRKNGSSYFEDLVAAEKRAGSRSIAKRGGWNWLAAFSPLGSNEITAIHEEENDFGSLTETDVQELSAGIAKVLAFYEGLGHSSFNFTLYSVKKTVQRNGSRCVFKIVNRQNLYPNYRNDDYFLQKMLQSELILNLPEDLAAGMRTIF